MDGNMRTGRRLEKDEIEHKKRGPGRPKKERQSRARSTSPAKTTCSGKKSASKKRKGKGRCKEISPNSAPPRPPKKRTGGLIMMSSAFPPFLVLSCGSMLNGERLAYKRKVWNAFNDALPVGQKKCGTLIHDCACQVDGKFKGNPTVILDGLHARNHACTGYEPEHYDNILKPAGDAPKANTQAQEQKWSWIDGYAVMMCGSRKGRHRAFVLEMCRFLNDCARDGRPTRMVNPCCSVRHRCECVD